MQTIFTVFKKIANYFHSIQKNCKLFSQYLKKLQTLFTVFKKIAFNWIYIV